MPKQNQEDTMGNEANPSRTGIKFAIDHTEEKIKITRSIEFF